MAAWLAEIGLISARDFAGQHRPPLPSELLATFVVFGGLALVGGTDVGRRPAGAVGWGIVLATLLSSKVNFLAPVGAFFAPAAGAGSVPIQSAPAAAGAPEGAIAHVTIA